MEGAGAIREHVPTGLLNEVWKALPPDHPCREVLIRWTNAEEGTDLEASELEDVARRLIAFAHDYKGEEGELGRLVGSEEGLLVGPDRGGVASIHAPVVLALALRRLLLLQAVGLRVTSTQGGFPREELA
jgi:hypothetical protein